MNSTQRSRTISIVIALLYLCLNCSAQVWQSSLHSDIVRRVHYSDMTLVYMTDLSMDSVYKDRISISDQFIKDTQPKFDDMIMELMVVPKPLHLTYKPTKPLLKNIMQLENSFKSLTTGNEVREWISQNSMSLSDIRRKVAVEHPEMVNTTWSEIPEPWRNMKEGEKMELTENDNVTLAEMFREEFRMSGKMKALPKEKKGPWEVSGEENMQLSQLFLANWIKGGESNVTLLSDMRAKAVLTYKRHSWENSGTHKVGFTHTSTLGTRVSNDAFDLQSKYGFKATKKWYYSFMTTFKTQMFRNYASNDKEKKNLKSTMLSPAYLQLVVGMDYKVTNLSVLLSPYTASLTIVADTADIDQTKYGVSKNSRTSWVNGFSVNTTWKKTITYGITYSTKMELFYEYFHKNGQKRFSWENVLDMQINRFLTTRLLTELRYYDNESKKFQFKENFSIAFKYKF